MVKSHSAKSSRNPLNPVSSRHRFKGLYKAQWALIILFWVNTMIVKTFNAGTKIELSDIVDISIRGYVRLIYEDNGISVIVDSVPMMFIPNVNIKDIISDITIELEPTF